MGRPCQKAVFRCESDRRTVLGESQGRWRLI